MGRRVQDGGRCPGGIFCLGRGASIPRRVLRWTFLESGKRMSHQQSMGEKAPNPLKGTGIDDKQISVVTELRRQHGKTTKVEKDRDW